LNNSRRKSKLNYLSSGKNIWPKRKQIKKEEKLNKMKKK